MLIVSIALVAAIMAIWVGYPLAMAFLARRARRESESSVPPSVSISVIVATRETGTALRGRVADVLAQEAPGLMEVVVGLDASVDARVSPDLSGLAGVRVVRATGSTGKAGALNAAVAASVNDVLVFTDVAQRFQPGAIGALVAAVATSPHRIVSGELWIGEDDKPQSVGEWYWKFERWLRANEARVHSVIGVTGAIYGMPRALWAPLPEGCILDDVYTPMRLVLEGHRVGFVRDAVAVDSRRFAGRREYARKVRTQTGVLQLLRLLPQLMTPSLNPVFTQFLFHKLLRLATPPLVLIAGLTGVAGANQLVPPEVRTIAFAVVLGGIGFVLLSGRVRAATTEALLLQWAVLRAAVNGARGRWDVWQ